MQMNPKVQIVIPLYNAEKYINRCLDSLTRQTFKNWQAIIADDGSKDNGGRIAMEYADKDSRFVYVYQEVNKGVSETRNHILSLLTAEYAAFLDSDDYWEDNMLEEMLNEAEKYSCDVVQCRYVYDFPGGKQILPKGAFKTDVYFKGNDLKKIYIKMMLGINMNHVCMKLIRTELIKNLRFDKSLKTAEDLKFCIELFKNADSYRFINKPMYHYCRNEESLTGKSLGFKEKIKANRIVSRELVKALGSRDMDKLRYRVLAYLRPYTIAFSKVFRMAVEKTVSRN